MLESLKPRSGRRWPRGQRFRLSFRGAEALAAYRAAVREAQALGRGALEAAQVRWAGPLGVRPGDGVVLAEVQPGRRSLADLSRALESCGTSPGEVRDAVERLVDAGLIEPLPAAQAAA